MSKDLADKPFRITDYLPRIRVGQVGEAGWEQDFSGTYANSAAYATLSSTPQGGAWVFASEIDIAGWTKEGLTAFFAQIGQQRSSPYFSTYANPTGAAGAVIQDVVILTDVPLSDAETTGVFAGFPNSPSDWMTVKYAKGTQRVQTSTAPVNLTENDSWAYGSNDPTASGTLYVYRYVIVAVPLPSALTATVDFPTIRLVAEGIATEEPEFVYLTRLRRSYELRENG